jgi:hypothetical protein
MARYAMLSGLAPVIIFSVIGLPPFTAQAAKAVQECAPPGGVGSWQYIQKQDPEVRR